MNDNIVRLVDCPEMKERAAKWFHEKWQIPEEAYLESMEECLQGENAVPQWYLVMEEDKRCQGIAGRMLDYVCEIREY